QDVGGGDGLGAVDVGEDRGLSPQHAVEGQDLSLRGKGGLLGEEDVGREVAFADERGGTVFHRLGVGRGVDLAQAALGKALDVELAAFVEGKGDLLQLRRACL